MASQESCVFQVSVVSANNVWNVGSRGAEEEEEAMAAISVLFPGDDKEDNRSHSEPVRLIVETESHQKESANSTDKVEAKAIKAKKDEGGRVTIRQQHPASYSLGFIAQFSRVSDWFLWNDLLRFPLVVLLHWVSASDQTKVAVGNVSLDLSTLLLSGETVIEGVFPVLPIKLKNIPRPEGKKDAKENVAPRKSSIKGKKEILPQECDPALLENAALKINVSLSSPILSNADRERGILMEYIPTIISPSPKVIDSMVSGLSPFTYAIAFEIPGLSGSWWNSLNTLDQEEKAKLAISRLVNGLGKVTTVSEHFVSNETTQGQTVKTPSKSTPKRTSINCNIDANVQSNYAGHIEGEEDQSAGKHKVETIITWEKSIRCFLPSVAVRELKGNIQRRHNWYGEVARFVTGDQTPLDPDFNKFHASFNLDLLPLVEEGLLEVNILCPLLKHSKSKEHGVCLLNQESKKYKDPNLKVDKTSNALENGDTYNAWEEFNSCLAIHVKTNCPLEPVWVPPPEPSMKLVDIVPPRPKFPKFSDVLNVVMQELRDLIKSGATVIESVQRKLLSEDAVDSSNSWIKQHALLWDLSVSRTMILPRAFTQLNTFRSLHMHMRLMEMTELQTSVTKKWF